MEFVELLKTKTDQEIKIGKKIRCINPQHEDEEPSMQVYEEHAYCFGCGYLFPPKKQLKKENEFFMLTEYFENVNRFYRVCPFFYDVNKIFWLWNWEKNNYVMCDEIELLNLIDNKLSFRGNTIPATVRNNYVESFRRIGRNNNPRELGKHWIQFGGDLYNISHKQKMFGTEQEFHLKAHPDYFLTNHIPYEIGETEETPTMDILFDSWVGEQNKITLYELIAYCCIPDYPIHVFFTLIGSGRNGKSQFIKIIKKFLGTHNITSAELDRIADPSSRFEGARLYKKLACFMSETNFNTLQNTSLLKQLTGGDTVGFEFKNKNPFVAENYAKVIISTNSLPSSTDTSDGFYRRWLIIEFPNNFEQEKDIVDTIPEKEYNSLARKCLILSGKLLERGFTHRGTIEERKERYIMASNPLPYFIKLCCETDIYNMVKNTDLFNNYKQYLLLNKKRVVGYKEFKSACEQEGMFSRHTTFNTEQGWWIDCWKMKKNWENIIKLDIIKRDVIKRDVIKKENIIENSQNLYNNEFQSAQSSLFSHSFSNIESKWRNSELQALQELLLNKKQDEISPCLKVLSNDKTIQQEEPEFIISEEFIIQDGGSSVLDNITLRENIIKLVKTIPQEVEDIISSLQNIGYKREDIDKTIDLLNSNGDIYYPYSGKIAKL